MSLQLEIVEDPARECAAMLVSAASAGGHLVLSGGSTPRAAYQELVQASRAVGVDLGQTTFWFGDERCVALDDDRSNFKMVKESLIDPLGAESQPDVRRIRGELGPDEAADAYERELRDSGPAQFDLVLLGMGPDGHTASLFPDQGSLSERSRLAIGVPQAGLEPFVPRVSLTLTALAAARQVVFLVAGAAKADAVAAAFRPGAPPDPHVPSSLVVPMAKEVTVLLDQAAASKL